MDSGLRVCLVSASYLPYPSGVSEHVHNLGRTLAALGHRVSVLTTRYPLPPPADLPVTCLGRALVLPANRSRFTLPVGWRLGPRVRDFLGREAFDVVHCHGIFPPEISYWAALHARCPVVVTFHTYGVDLPRFVRAGFRRLFGRLSSRIRARIAVSEAGRRWAEPWFPGSYDVIPNGVDTARFRPGPATPPGPTVLFVGRLEKRKGLPVLLQAMPRVLASHPDAALVVVGSGPDEARSRRLACRLGIDSRVHFAGRATAGELPGLYAGCTLFAAPALGGEAMGIVLIEAMASGRPVLASRIPGYDEVVEPGTSGMLVEPGVPASWATAISRLLDTPDELRRLSDGALARSREYAWPRVADRVVAVYRRVVA